MTLGEKIKKLRVENNWTQEKFAEMMGVSAQAVSRWETDSSMPDISMLAPIAYTFNVSCDYLLGVDLNSKENDIFRIRKEAWESIVGENSNKWANAYSMIKEGLKQYPDSWILKDSLVHFLAVLAMPKHNEDYLSAGKELNQLCEDVLAKCPIQKYRYNAIYHLCGAATATNNRERAMELAKAMPKQYQCQDFSLLHKAISSSRSNRSCRNPHPCRKGARRRAEKDTSFHTTNNQAPRNTIRPRDDRNL